MSVQVVCAAVGAALAGAGAMGLLVRPTRRLAPLVAPYAQLARSRLGRVGRPAIHTRRQLKPDRRGVAIPCRKRAMVNRACHRRPRV